MAQYYRLRSGNPMIRIQTMRSAMAMIEVIFAIVIIAISVMTIPTMMLVADKANKGVAIDEDVMARLSGWTLDKFQARWDLNYKASGSGALWINQSDLNCSRGSGTIWYRIGSDENISSMQCDDQNRTPSAILSIYPDGNLSLGIERLNGGSESIAITPAGGTPYSITATYDVDYVDSSVLPSGSNAQIATWVLGSSSSINPASTGLTVSHLKRVVTRFDDAGLDVNTTLTFFKSNKGN